MKPNSPEQPQSFRRTLYLAFVVATLISLPINLPNCQNFHFPVVQAAGHKVAVQTPVVVTHQSL